MNRSRRQDMSYGSGRPPGSGPIASAKPRTRIIAVAATLAVFGGIVAVTQVSNAETRGRRPSGSACATSGPGATESPAPTIAPGEPSPGATAGSYAGDEPGVQHHIGDGQAPADAEALAANNNCTPAADNDDDNDGDNNDGDNGDNNNDNNDGDNGDDNDNNGGNNGRGLDVLGDSCDNSRRGGDEQ